MILLDTLARDVRYGLRSLRRDLGATVFVVAIAGIGIGASTTVFSICRALILRPLPFERPERLIWIANGTSENLSAQTVQVNNLLELRERSRSWTDIAGFFPFYAPGDIRLTGAGEPERLTGVPVTQTFFPLLGVRPLAGRFFDRTETRENAPRTVVLGHDFWKRRFAGDRAIVGRTIVLDDAAVTVIGVLPSSFDFAATFTPGRRADVFLPFPLSPEKNRQGNTLALIGRLRDGVTIEAAQSEASAIGDGVVRDRAADRRNGLAPRLMTLRERVSGRFEAALFVLAGAVSFLMLLVCANLSNLLLVRASGRRREMAIRTALGAPRQHLVRQMLVESLVLNAGGAVLGVALAIAGTFAVARVQGTTIPLLNGVQVDMVVLGFTVFVAVVTGIAFGLIPALHASAFALPSFLAEGSRGSTSGRSGRVRNIIVVVEVALVCVLLTGAGLLGRSLGRVLDVRPGFSTENVIAIRVDPRVSFGNLAQNASFFDAIVREAGSVPGVQSLGLTDALPLGDNFGWRRWDAAASDKPQLRDEDRINPLVRMIDEGYLAAMQIPLRSGRAFTTSDELNSEPVIIINERLAKALWPGQDAMGRMLRTSDQNRRVVGIVGDVRYFGLDRDADMEMYMPIRTGDYQSVDLVVRGSLPPAALAGGVRAALRRVDPTLPVAEFRTMEQLVDRSVFARRFVVLLVAGFAAFGLLLASLGIYAVISYSVTQRTQEIGIRMALGATPGNLLAQILGQTGTLALLGVAVGLPASWIAARAIRGLLFDVGASDPTTFIAVLLVLGGVAALAGYVPARRATHVDPATALRPR